VSNRGTRMAGCCLSRVAFRRGFAGGGFHIRTQRSPVKIRAHAGGSERPHPRAERNDGDKRYEGADDADHNDVAIAVPVRRSADREQCDHRTIVRQAIERA
jgi:hypothetical protein